MMQPEWNPQDPRASLHALAEFFHDHARTLFVQDGTHLEILFLLAEDGTTQPVPIAAPMTRESVVETLQQQIPGSGVYGLIHISEAWGYIPKGERDHTLKQLKWGEMKVSDLQAKDRIELLLVSLLSREGDQITWFDEIVRADNDKVSLGHSGQSTNATFPLGNVFAT